VRITVTPPVRESSVAPTANLFVCLGITLVIARAGVRWGVFAGALCLVALWGTIGWLLAARGVYLSPLLHQRDCSSRSWRFRA
jgi:hypothetical protein